jgi:hypothetical protein
MLERAKAAVSLANVVDCDPCPNSSPTPIEECQDCRWSEYAESFLKDLAQGFEKEVKDE